MEILSETEIVFQSILHHKDVQLNSSLIHFSNGILHFSDGPLADSYGLEFNMSRIVLYKFFMPSTPDRNHAEKFLFIRNVE